MSCLPLTLPRMLPEYILKNGSFESHFDILGNGYLVARGCYLTSHRPSSDDGIFFFIRDVESKKYWSATPAPAFVTPERFRMNIGVRSAHIERTDDSIETALDTIVPETGDFELQRLTLTNQSKMPRHLEVTSSLDIILLFDRLRDSFHQTFSNMFIGAEFSEERHALIYHRRFFDDPERFPIFTHRIFFEAPAEFLGFETDREAFIGRGRPFGRPIALDRPLKNTRGYILDPLANLRASVPLAPRERVELFFVSSAHFAPEQPEALFARFPRIESVRKFFVSEFGADHSTRTEIPVAIKEIFPDKPPFPPIPESSEKSSPRDDFDENRLLFWNGFGGFDPKTHDYHMRIRPDRLPPQPWANILGNPDFGTMTTENALGTTWYKNSKHGRLSPWSNNAVTDPPSEAIFAKQIDTDEAWSLTPSPLPASSEYCVTHGRGFSRYESERDAIRQILTVSIDPAHSIKHFAIEFENTNTIPLQREVIFFLDAPHDHVSDIPPRFPFSRLLSEENALLLDPSFFSPNPTQEAVLIHGAIIGSEPIHSLSFSKEKTFGRVGIFSSHISLEEKRAPSPPDSSKDACIILSSRVSLAPGEKKNIFFALLAGGTAEETRALIPIARDSWQRNDPATLETVRKFWRNETMAPAIQTPDPSLDILFNTWLPYQTLVSRMWGRIGFYQPGGAYGFRDQLQDAISLWYIDPKITRDHILSAAREQYEDGGVRAWWSPDSDFGVRSAASDQALWLPWAIGEYLRLSGDKSLLDETVPFLFTPENDDSARFDVRQEKKTGASATVLEHCLRAIEYTQTLGMHGLPVIREGDWNDGLNRVGQSGKGESVWLGFFLFSVLERFADILSKRGNELLSDTYKEWAMRLRKSLNKNGWDGHWFLRAFYDDGTPLGSEGNHECRIDAIAQIWSILSDAGDPEKSKEAMENLERFLYDPESRILKLLDPPFNDLAKKNPGYIKDYPPGIRENGSQYNHAVFWAAEAFVRIGRTDMVSELLLAANPIRRSESERKALLYETEPYSVAADIYSAEHRGKGGWTWYTASAGLMYRSIIETLFGIRFEYGQVSFRPALPPEWEHCSITLPWKSTLLTFAFHATRTPHTNTLQNITLDGKPLTFESKSHSIPLPDDGQPHRYEISLG